MAVPGFQDLMLPVLRKATEGEIRIGDVVEQLANDLNLSPEDRAELLPSGTQTTFANRVHWARSYLKHAGLVENTRRAHFKVTPRGTDVLSSPPPRIDIPFLRQFPEFVEFQNRQSGSSEATAGPVQVIKPDQSGKTPEEMMRLGYNQMNALLADDILDRILQAPPPFFEKLVVNLLLAMGYGGTVANAGRAIGRAGDDGVDGVIDQDPLGLDRVYVQAKRYQAEATIGPAAIRDFFGSLDMHKATKGLFVTTSNFSSAATDTANRLGKRIVLIDGQTLTQLMIRYNIGCRVEEALALKRIDEEFFEP